MSKSAKELYAVPGWMRPYLPLFQNTGGNDVEELLHDDSTSMFANSIRYMLIVSVRSQYTLLMNLHQRGSLSTISDTFLAEVQAQGVEMFGEVTIKIGEEEDDEDIVYAGKQALLFAAQLRQGGAV